MRKFIYLLMLLAVSCTKRYSVHNEGIIVPAVPDTVPSLSTSMKFSADRFTCCVNVEYNNDTVFVSELPDGVSAVAQGANLFIRSSAPGVEYRLSGVSRNGSFALESKEHLLLSFSSLKLFSYKRNTISLSALNGAFVRAIGNDACFLMDGTPNDTVYSPKNSAAMFIVGDVVFSEGNIALRGERKSAVICTGHLVIDGANIAVEAARSDAITADSGMLVASGNLLAISQKDALKSKKGNIVVLGGNIKLETSEEKGDGMQAKNIYHYSGNTSVVVNGAAARGINSKGAVYLLGGTLDIKSKGSAIFAPKKNDYTSGACVKAETHFYMNDAFVSLDNCGDGGKGINCNGLLQIDGGTLLVCNTGNDLQHPEDYDAHTSAKGIKCDSTMLIRGGLIEVLVYGNGERCEGIEAKYDMTIEGDNTTMYIYAYDDAINSGGTLTLKGGRIYSYSVANDAIDSNSYIKISGGIVVADGSSNPEQGVDVDDNSRFSITGGTLLSVGGSGGPFPAMPQGDDTVQPVIVWNGVDYARGDYISLSDERDSVICAYRMCRTMNRGTLLLSSSRLFKGNNYTLSFGDTVGNSNHLGNGLYISGQAMGIRRSVGLKIDNMLNILSSDGEVLDINSVGGRNGFPPPPPPSHNGHDMPFPPPVHFNESKNGFPPPPSVPPHFHGNDGKGMSFPPDFQRVDTEGYSGRNLPGGGWLPVK